MGQFIENYEAERPLIERILRGNTNAFCEVVESTEGLVAQIVFKMFANPEDRKDLAQDIYFKAFQKMGEFPLPVKALHLDWPDCLQYLHQLS